MLLIPSAAAIEGALDDAREEGGEGFGSEGKEGREGCEDLYVPFDMFETFDIVRVAGMEEKEPDRSRQEGGGGGGWYGSAVAIPDD